MKIQSATVEDAARIAEVQVKTWQQAYAGIVSADEMTIAERTNRWRSHLSNPEYSERTFIATEQDHVIGFCAGGRSRRPHCSHDCELYAVYVLPELHGKGIGKQLTRALVAKFVEAGFKTMLVWVLEANPSKKFYERLGGKFLKKEPIVLGRKSYPEVSFEWQDIQQIFW